MPGEFFLLVDSDKKYNIMQARRITLFIASTCGEESDREGDMDMTQEENAAIELEVSGLFEEESEADDIGKQRSKELVVVSVSTHT